MLDRTLVRQQRAGPRKAETGNASHVGAPMPGLVVARGGRGGGAACERGQQLLTLEAMKMETTLYARAAAGEVAEVLVQRRAAQVEARDLLVIFEWTDTDR